MDQTVPAANLGKFRNARVTARGEPRASVALSDPRTLWFATGTLCNIACAHCYIESSPTNDRLAYLTEADVTRYLDEAAGLGWPLAEVGFTGGEPFMNPEIIAMTETALSRGLEVLILTNAMQPMMRPRVQAGLRRLRDRYGDRLALRVSLDHPDRACHDEERGAGSHDLTIAGIDWLVAEGFRVAVAGRQLWGGTEAGIRAAFAALFAARGWPIDAENPGQTVIFPEMDLGAEVPEITTACWGILHKAPEEVMCASARMVVRRKDADAPGVVACTLLPYAPEFELGETLAEASRPVFLNHPHCAKFCVLGGARCSA